MSLKYQAFTKTMYWHAGWFWKFIIFLIIMKSAVFKTCFCVPLTTSKEIGYDPKKDVEYFFPDEEEEEMRLNYKPTIETLRIESDIRFRYARTKVIPIFVNEDKKKSHAVNFTLTIPQDAFITNLEMKVDGTTYEANITSNEKVRDIFAFSQFEGRSVTAVTIEQGKKANSYKVQFLIGAKKKVKIRLTYEELLVRNDNEYEYAFNLKPEESDAIIEVEAYSIFVSLEETEPIKIHIPEMGGEFSTGRCIKPEVKKISPRKAKILWNSPKTDDDSQCSPFNDPFMFHYSLENESNSGEILIRNGYFVHFFAPVEMNDLIKHVVFVLDVSDSMTGTKINQLKSAMKTIIDELKPEDFFNIITFSTDSEVWSHFNGLRLNYLYPFPANGTFKENGIHFIDTKLIPRGSTNILGALEKAFEVIHNVSFSDTHRNSFDFIDQPYFNKPKHQNYLSRTLPENVESVLIFLTDGEPTSGNINQVEILNIVKSINKNPFVPIYTLAFGDSADYEFLKELSYQNGAFSRKITESADADIQVAEFYNEISSPVMSNVTFKYTSANPGFSVAVDVPNNNHLIFKGQELVYAGRFLSNSSLRTKQNITAEIYGTTRKGSDKYTSKINSVCVPSSGKGRCSSKDELTDDIFLERLMAYLTIKKLVLKDLHEFPEDEYSNLNVSSCEKALEIGIDEQEYIWIAADVLNNRLVKTCNFLKAKEKIISIAMKYKFVTPFTSLVMRTKSIGEVERGIGASSNEDNVDWEWFLGFEIPLPPTSKYSSEFLNSTLPTFNTVQNISNLLKSTLRNIWEIPFLNLFGRNQTSTKNNVSSIVEEKDRLHYIMSQGNASKPTRNDFISNSSNLDTFNTTQNISLPINAAIDTTSGSMNDQIKMNYTLEDVTWMKPILNIPVLKNDLLIPTYYNVLADSHNTADQHFQPCHLNSSTTVSGVCQHLKDCIQSNFIHDFELFKSSYICQILIDGERYLGSCCLT